MAYEFQSTLPVWGGTGGSPWGKQNCMISIHPPREGRDEEVVTDKAVGTISIHPPREGRDSLAKHHRRKLIHFNPPSLCGEGH